MRVAIMQPAFIPPASYFRLFAASDVFVVLDTVQWDRRWYTHRQKLTARNGRKEWLTLPIAKTDRDTTMIKNLQWQPDAQQKWGEQIKKFNIDAMELLYLFANPLDFILGLLLQYRENLKINPACSVVRASAIRIDESLRGQDRIIAICKYFGATEYINSEGGISLYDEQAFRKEGMKLRFLPPWEGSYDSILERFVKDEPEDIRKEINIL
jgi:hypothetical protein